MPTDTSRHHKTMQRHHMLHETMVFSNGFPRASSIKSVSWASQALLEGLEDASMQPLRGRSLHAHQRTCDADKERKKRTENGMG